MLKKKPQSEAPRTKVRSFLPSRKSSASGRYPRNTIKRGGPVIPGLKPGDFQLGINELIKECHRIAQSKGWWEETRNDGELIALMHSELSEALEAMRNHLTQDALAEELADCCIRIFDYCGSRKIDLEKALLKKIEYNKTRPYRHGKKF